MSYSHKSRLVGGADVIEITTPAVRGGVAIEDSTVPSVLNTTLSLMLHRDVDEERVDIIFDSALTQSVLADISSAGARQVGATVQPVIGARIDDGRLMVYARDPDITRIDVLDGSANAVFGMFPSPHPKGVSVRGQVVPANSSEAERAFHSGAFLLRHGDRTSSSINRGLVALSDNVDALEAQARRSHFTIAPLPINANGRIVEVTTPGTLLQTTPLADIRTLFPGYSLDTTHPDEIISTAAAMRTLIAPVQEGVSELPLIGFCDELGRNIHHKASGVPTALPPKMLRAYITYGEDLPADIADNLGTRDGTNLTRSTWQRADFMGTIAGPTLPPPEGASAFAALVLDQYTIKLRGSSAAYGTLLRRGDVMLCEQGIFEVDEVCVDDETITLVPFSRSVQAFLLLPPDAQVNVPAELGRPQTTLRSVQFFTGLQKTDAVRYFLFADRELDTYTHAWLRVPARDANVHELSDKNERLELQRVSRVIDPYADNPREARTHDLRTLYASGGSKTREYVRVLETEQERWLPASRYEVMRSVQNLHIAPQAPQAHPLSTVPGRTRYITQVLPLLAKFVHNGQGARHSVANTLYDMFERGLTPSVDAEADLVSYLAGIAQGAVTLDIIRKVSRGDVVTQTQHDDAIQLYEATLSSLGLSRVHNDSITAREDTFTLTSDEAEFSEHDVGRAFVYVSGTRTYTLELVTWVSPKTARFSSVDDADAHTGVSTGTLSRTLGVDFGTRAGMTQAHAPRRRDNALSDDIRNAYSATRIKENVAEHVNDVQLRYLEMPRVQSSVRPLPFAQTALTFNALLGTSTRDVSGTSVIAQDPLALSDNPLFGAAISTTLRDMMLLLKTHGYLSTNYFDNVEQLAMLEPWGDPIDADATWSLGAVLEQRAYSIERVIEMLELLERMGYVVSSSSLADIFGVSNVGDVINSSDLDPATIPAEAQARAFMPDENDQYPTLIITKRVFFDAELWFRLHNIEASLGTAGATVVDAATILDGGASEPTLSTDERIRVSARSIYLKSAPPPLVSIRSDIFTEGETPPLRALTLELDPLQVAALRDATHAYHLAARGANGVVSDIAVFYQGESIHRVLLVGFGAVIVIEMGSDWSTTSVEGIQVPVHTTFGTFSYGLASAVARGTHVLPFAISPSGGKIVLHPQRPLVSTIPMPRVESSMIASIVSSGADADLMVNQLLGGGATLYGDAHAAIAEEQVDRQTKRTIHASADNTHTTRVINSIAQDTPSAAVSYSLETEGRIPTLYAPRTAYIDGFKPKYDRVLDVTVDVGACAISAASTGYSSLESATYSVLTDTENDGIFSGSLKNGPATIRVVSSGDYDVLSGRDELTGFASPRGASPYGKNGPAAPILAGVSDRWTGEADVPISARDGIQVQTNGTGLRVTTSVTHLPDGTPAIFKGTANLDAHPVPASIVTEGGHDVAVLDDTPSENSGYPYPALRAMGGVRVHGALRLDGDIPSTFYAAHNIVPGQDLLSGVSGHINPVEASRHSTEYTQGSALTEGLTIGSDPTLHVNDLYVHTAADSSAEERLGLRNTNTYKTRVPQLGERVNAVEFDFSALDLASDTWAKDENVAINYWGALPCVYFGVQPQHMALLRVFIGPDAIVLALSAPGIALGSAAVGRSALINIGSETAALQRGNISCVIRNINREIVPGVCLVTLQGAPNRFDHYEPLDGFTIADQLGGLEGLPALAANLGAHYVALDNPGLVYVAAVANMNQHITSPTDEGSGSTLRVSGVIHGREWSLNAYQVALSDRLWLRNDRGDTAGVLYASRGGRLSVDGTYIDVTSDHVQIDAPRVDISGATDISGQLTVGGVPVLLDEAREVTYRGQLELRLHAPFTAGTQGQSQGVYASIAVSEMRSVSDDSPLDVAVLVRIPGVRRYADTLGGRATLPVVSTRDASTSILNLAQNYAGTAAEFVSEMEATPVYVAFYSVGDGSAMVAQVRQLRPSDVWTWAYNAFARRDASDAGMAVPLVLDGIVEGTSTFYAGHVVREDGTYLAHIPYAAPVAEGADLSLDESTLGAIFVPPGIDLGTLPHTTAALSSEYASMWTRITDGRLSTADQANQLLQALSSIELYAAADHVTSVTARAVSPVARDQVLGGQRTNPNQEVDVATARSLLPSMDLSKGAVGATSAWTSGGTESMPHIVDEAGVHLANASAPEPNTDPPLQLPDGTYTSTDGQLAWDVWHALRSDPINFFGADMQPSVTAPASGDYAAYVSPVPTDAAPANPWEFLSDSTYPRDYSIGVRSVGYTQHPTDKLKIGHVAVSLGHNMGPSIEEWLNGYDYVLLDTSSITARVLLLRLDIEITLITPPKTP